MKTHGRRRIMMNICHAIVICILVVILAQANEAPPPGQGLPQGAGRPPRPGASPPSQPDSFKTPPEVEVTADIETVVTPSIRFGHLTTEDELSNNAITAILQDRRGFMWIGTQDGLNRFDGYRFTTYRHDPNNLNSLSNNYIEDLLEDRDGNLWVATQGGVNRFDPHTGNIVRYQHEPENPDSLSANEIKTIFQDHSGTLWFGGLPHVGLNEFQPKTERFVRYVHRSDMGQSFGIDMMLEDRTHGFWIAAERSLVKFIPDTQQFTYYTPNPDEHFMFNLVQDADEYVWIGDLSGLHKFDPATEQFTTYETTPPKRNGCGAECGM